MNFSIVALAVSFAFGAIVVLDAHNRHPTPCKPEATAPAPQKHQVIRETIVLSHPLGCERGWIRNCADFGPCKETCL